MAPQLPLVADGMNPYYEHSGITIYHGDCFSVVDGLCFRCAAQTDHDSLGGKVCRASADSPIACQQPWRCVCTDPPYGIDYDGNSQRFTRRASPYWDNVDNSKVRNGGRMAGDSKPFDPRPWIGGPAIMWGANHYATRLLRDSGGWLVWDKRLNAEDMAEKGWPLSEAELAWTNVRGSIRVFRNLWSGLLRSSEKGQHHHPTQKPVELMQWCLQFLPADGIVLDPFMGSGTTLVAAKNLGRRAIGIEIEERYCEIAARRCEQEVLDFREPAERGGTGDD